VTDPIHVLSERLAADPDSLVFLELGETLRRRGLLDAALAVAETGLRRHRDLAAAWDLLGRVRSDRGDGDGAFDAWTEALRREPRHPGALRGLAYLAYRAGDVARAERHLLLALEAAPDDRGLRAALDRLREGQREELGGGERGGAAAADASATDLAPGVATILADTQGQLLLGRLRVPGMGGGAGGEEVADRVAAELGSVCREAARAAHLLHLGPWRGLTVECSDTRMRVVPVNEETVLLVVADLDVPARRLALEAERAATAARRWLERLG
jgi:tetratricopeptide (TPR) repeat protein